MRQKLLLKIFALSLILVFTCPAPVTALSAGADGDTEVEAGSEVAELFTLINTSREEDDRSRLYYCEDLSAVARSHAKDMIARDYFSHRCPDGNGVSQRVRDAGIAFTRLGENLAGHTCVMGAHGMIMRSRGHRAITLGAYDRVGLAVVRGGRYGTMIVQIFAGTE